MPYFAFTDGSDSAGGRDTFVVIIDDPAKVEHARALIAGDTEDSARIGGRVTVAPVEHNIGWSYRIDPANIVFYDVSAEVHDAAMTAVEAFIQTGRDLQELLPQYRWLSWSTRLTAELNEVAGTGAGETLDGTALADILFGRAGNDVLRGRDGDDHLVAASGADRLLGGIGRDKLSGGDGNDRHDGGAGADVMAGGKGHDQYVVDDAGDRIIEAAGGGSDSVTSSVDFALPDHVEQLILSGSGPLAGRGNVGVNSLTGNGAANLLLGGAGGDTIKGGAGNDRLYGEAGGDVLVGGAGLDRFLFNTAPGPGNVDRILDFSVADDAIWLARYAFAGLGPNGTLSPDAFRQGAAADADDRILYDAATGRICYDADGNGAGAAILFAIVSAGTPLTHADFIIYG